MKRITFTSLACLTFLTVLVATGFAPQASATPNPNSAVVKTRIFNNCPTTTLNVVNNYPSLISIEDQNLSCFGFANRHAWTLSTDGVDGAVFDNNSDFRLSADLVLSGTGEGEAGLRISPWWSKDVDGTFMVNTGGEIAIFGGRLPFYTFTGNYGLHYTKGDLIHLAVTYKPNGLSSASPATIEYEVTYNGSNYSSGVLPFDEANPAEDPPHGLWGMLNDGRVGGYDQNYLDPANPGENLKATFTDIRFVICPVVPSASAAVVKTRIFNNCPTTTLNVANNYPSLISIEDQNLSCFGFANRHAWTLSSDGVNETVFNNNSDFRLSADLVLSGTGEGEAGLRISPWWSKDVDGTFMVNTGGEIAIFGGRLPFYTFTGNYGLHYTKGDLIHLAATYKHNGLSAASPATIEYEVTYNGSSYSSGALPFDEANPAEDPPHGLWGMLNDARVGGYDQNYLDPANPGENLKASFTNIAYGPDVRVDVTPNSLNLNAGGKWVSAHIEPQPPLAASDIDVSTLRMNGIVGVDPAADVTLGDQDGDGIADLMVKFSRIAVFASAGGSGKVTVTGEVGGNCFQGSDVVRVLAVNSPNGGSVLASGSTTTVAWDVVAASSAAIYYSDNDGGSWTLVAGGQPNTGSYAWSVPNATAGAARIAVVLDDGTADGIAGITGAFSIESIVGVGDGGAVAFALPGASPNPSKGALTVGFSLPNSSKATLSLYDVAGRRVVSREVGSLGAGRHTVTLAERLRAGMYVIQLSQDGRSLTSRAAVVR